MTYAMTLDNSWELMTEDEMYDVNGGVTVGTMATIIDVALIGASLIIGAVAPANSTWLAGAVSRGLIRNILTKSALSALKTMLAPFLSFIGVTTQAITLILSAATALGSALFNITIGTLIASALDFNGDGYVLT